MSGEQKGYLFSNRKETGTTVTLNFHAPTYQIFKMLLCKGASCTSTLLLYKLRNFLYKAPLVMASCFYYDFEEMREEHQNTIVVMED